MTNTAQLINLTPEELLSLIKEKTVKRDGICIAANASFLTILALLHEEMARRRMPYAKLQSP